MEKSTDPHQRRWTVEDGPAGPVEALTTFTYMTHWLGRQYDANPNQTARDLLVAWCREHPRPTLDTDPRGHLASAGGWPIRLEGGGSFTVSTDERVQGDDWGGEPNVTVQILGLPRRALYWREAQELAKEILRHDPKAGYRKTEQAEATNEQLRYERRLLGWARMTLDLIAAGDPSRQEQARREAEDIAQRIVDEIGHPVTDEPALGPGFRAAIERARAEHIRDDSNPRGPWCNTCLTVWPCRTAVALDPCPHCDGSRFEPGTEAEGDWDPAVMRHHPDTGEPCSVCNGTGKR